MSDYDFSDVFDSMFGSDSTGGTDKIATVQVREAGDTDGQTADDVELWMHACLAYRPADPTDAGKCQVMTVATSGRRVAIASRDLRSQDTFGALNKGDAAFGSPTGQNVMRANADGSIGMRHGDPQGGADAMVQIEKDQTILFQNQWGQVVLGADGFHVILASGEAVALGGGSFTVNAPQCSLACGTVALGLGAAVPLCLVPSNVPIGSAIPGFMCAKPTPNIFV